MKVLFRPSPPHLRSASQFWNLGVYILPWFSWALVQSIDQLIDIFYQHRTLVYRLKVDLWGIFFFSFTSAVCFFSMYILSIRVLCTHSCFFHVLLPDAYYYITGIKTVEYQVIVLEQLRVQGQWCLLTQIDQWNNWWLEAKSFKIFYY